MNTVDVIDAHCHLCTAENPYRYGCEAPVEELIEQMDLASVDVAVVLAVATQSNRKATAQYNDFIAHTVEEFPDRLVGFGSVHPADGKKALEELERVVDLGLKGIKLHPLFQHVHCDSPEMNQIAESAAQLDIPLFIHSYFPYMTEEAEHLYNLITAHPGTQFILAHTGGHTFLDFYAYVEMRSKGQDNVYFEISSLSVMFRKSPYTEHIKWLVEQMGADRVIFGSNYPRYQLVEALSAFDELGLSFDDSQQILGRTIAELLKL